jgi:hypothetical protein
MGPFRTGVLLMRVAALRYIGSVTDVNTPRAAALREQLRDALVTAGSSCDACKAAMGRGDMSSLAETAVTAQRALARVAGFALLLAQE